MADEQPAAPAPEGAPLDPLAVPCPSPALDALLAAMPGAVAAHRFWAKVPIVTVARDQIAAVLQFLRDDPRARMNELSTVFGTHYPGAEPGELEITYCLVSWIHDREMIVKTWTREGEPVPTVSGVFPCADWNERETYDLLGVTFAGHPDMTRILLPDDWVGHPLRRDYPLEGKPEDHKTYR